MNLIAIALGLVALLVYAWHESRKEGVKIWAWILDHKTVMIVASVAMTAAVLFRNVALPLLMAPVALALASAWLSGSFVNAIVKWVTDAYNYVAGNE